MWASTIYIEPTCSLQMGHVKLLDGQNNVTYKSRWKKEGFFLEALFYGKAMLILEVSVVLFKLGEAIATRYTGNEDDMAHLAAAPGLMMSGTSNGWPT